MVEAIDDHQHVVPLDDRRIHDISLKCWCEPRLDDEKPHVVVHNSADRREFEEGR